MQAVTICNMNLAKKSAVENFLDGSKEYSIVQSLCHYQGQRNPNETKPGIEKWLEVQKVLMKVNHDRKQVN